MTSLKLWLLTLSVAFSLVAWTMPDAGDGAWVMRFLMPIVAVVVLWYIFAKRSNSQLHSLLQTVQPANEIECAICGGPLVISDSWRCVTCHAERMVVS